MEITGEEYLDSNKACELFLVGKEWITKLWKDRGMEVQHIKISPKTVGRNDGFIMDVVQSGTGCTIRYYAKIQTAQIETVMIHYLLKYTKCGPEEFLIVLLASVEGGSINQKHGVITRAAENCTMASDWSGSELRSLRSSEKLFRTESFLFSIFIDLGRFGNLPNNGDNWGLSGFEKKIQSEKTDTDMCLMIIDFSSGGKDIALYSHKIFVTAWTKTIAKMFDVHLYDDALSSEACIVEQAKLVPWLHSKQAFVELLQRVCEATDNWLEQTAVSSGTEQMHSPPSSGSSSPSTVGVSPLLSCFANIGKPYAINTNVTLHCMFDNYDYIVMWWNEHLNAFLEWFPFPNDALSTVAAVPATDILTSTEDTECSTPVPPVDSVLGASFGPPITTTATAITTPAPAPDSSEVLDLNPVTGLNSAVDRADAECKGTIKHSAEVKDSTKRSVTDVEENNTEKRMRA